MKAGTRTLVLPDGGTMEIPLPGSNARFVMKPASMLHDAAGDSRIPTIIIGVVVGLAIGVGATVWYMRRR